MESISDTKKVVASESDLSILILYDISTKRPINSLLMKDAVVVWLLFLSFSD